MNYKKSILYVVLIGFLIFGIIGTSSCKRSKATDPSITGPDGFRIILSGVATPSTLYIPGSLPAVSTSITATALHNNGSPATNFQVVFKTGAYGYFENYQLSTVRTTNGNGVAQVTFFIPPGSNIKSSLQTWITAVLVDDGRTDNSMAQVRDDIPVIIYPYLETGILIHGHIKTLGGTGVGEVAVELQGDEGFVSTLDISRPSGSYEFYVPSGWSGKIVPSAPAYTFTPSERIYVSVSYDMMNEDYVALFSGGDTLYATPNTWDAPGVGGTQDIQILNSSSALPISYSVIPDATWLSVSPSSGSTPGVISITAEPNDTDTARTSTVTVTATGGAQGILVITVTQSPAFSIFPATINVAATAPTTHSITISKDASLRWHQFSGETWLLVTPNGWNTTSAFTVTVQTANPTSTARVGTVILETEDGDTATLTIIQNGS